MRKFRFKYNKKSTAFLSVAIALTVMSLPAKATISDKQNNRLIVANANGASAAAILIPSRIPVRCVQDAAKTYRVPEMALLSILKQESGGRTGIVGNNKNGSKDYGPAQFNDRSWGKYMREKYGITLTQLNNDMCQAISAQAYALRSEWNRCIKKGDKSIWCAVALYHSPTKKYQDRYVKGVWAHYEKMLKTGEF